MKTSKIIRDRIDVLLVHPDMFATPQEFDNFDNSDRRFLCRLFDGYDNILAYIQEDLIENAEVNGRAASVITAGNVTARPHESYEQRTQEFRFLYAEFMAYYFESIGD